MAANLKGKKKIIQERILGACAKIEAKFQKFIIRIYKTLCSFCLKNIFPYKSIKNNHKLHTIFCSSILLILKIINSILKKSLSIMQRNLFQ